MTGIVLLLVIHTWHDETGAEVVRIISARNATKNDETMNDDAKRLEPTPLANDDDEPDTSDIPEWTEEMWAHAEVGKFFRRPIEKE